MDPNTTGEGAFISCSPISDGMCVSLYSGTSLVWTPLRPQSLRGVYGLYSVLETNRCVCWLGVTIVVTIMNQN